ncbi:MAG: hypothetical protein A2418_03135 [Candidatus Brennerbacteria bacterium RIFOXYC1_FULL_41_11]|uniref:Uncharacterized protein n=1 Tax=Candidatus Brennerbacteria bacterium RIFOXYD1_FULL_41_16 TaxID=1797529 RepID=A0A1G1XKA1_9BACT|nr:MAG: hypothetical protein A2391_00740 [Candidatus Brennerbacteria bacterium RIFOXYB1_FULL_41_13]OGY39826.1 MAG: hypothetical protein A2418_03135 [Candidatus Brennerbacteria bacterium RIFOXYC1_FULL_41_11]OGY40575.1 MAG: hypothetical protein A2570_02465 [Candidatus Brennerbacteria bacterium RIFOXYD1_FULL_41_16]
MKRVSLYAVTCLLALGFIASIVVGSIGYAKQSGELSFIGLILFFVSLLFSLCFGAILTAFPQLLPPGRKT